MTGTRSIRQQRSPRAAFLNYGGRKTLHKGWVRALAALPLPRAQDVVTSRYGVKLRANWRDRTFQYCRAATYGRDLSGFLAAQDSPFAFVDIGANQGLYSLLAARNPQCARVIAFEIGRASCRERVWQYGYIWVVAVKLKNKKKRTSKLLT